MRIKKGDKVKVLLGKDRGRTGTVSRVLPKESKLVVKGINVAKKHVKPRGDKQKGGIIRLEKPLPVSKVAVVCPSCSQPTRIGYQVDKKGDKFRICKKCKSLLSSSS
jgi:large subunit ribosomal protein L24